MGWIRPVVAVVLLGSLVAGGAALAAWGRLSVAPETATYAVDIIGPGAASLYHGSIDARNATALSLLETAARAADLTMRKDAYPGMGTYVRAIGPYESHDASGWVYEVRRGDAWLSGDRAADRFAMHAGDALRWAWTDGGA